MDSETRQRMEADWVYEAYEINQEMDKFEAMSNVMMLIALTTTDQAKLDEIEKAMPKLNERLEEMKKRIKLFQILGEKLNEKGEGA